MITALAATTWTISQESQYGVLELQCLVNLTIVVGPLYHVIYCVSDWDSTIRTHSVDRFPVWNEAKAVLEDASCMEEGQRDTHDPLQLFLSPTEPGALWVLYLIKHFILSKWEDWHQMGTKDGMFRQRVGYEFGP